MPRWWPHACRACSKVYKAGGAQGIAAVAYGTETVPKCAKVVGPGSPWVGAAKRLLSHVLDTGTPAGPSELIVLRRRDCGRAPGRTRPHHRIRTRPRQFCLPGDLEQARGGRGTCGNPFVLVPDGRSARSLFVGRARRPTWRHRAGARRGGGHCLHQRLCARASRRACEGALPVSRPAQERGRNPARTSTRRRRWATS